MKHAEMKIWINKEETESSIHGIVTQYSSEVSVYLATLAAAHTT